MEATFYLSEFSENEKAKWLLESFTPLLKEKWAKISIRDDTGRPLDNKRLT